MAVVGPNGVGKSTLLKIVAGALEPEEGVVELGHEVHPGYFAQDHRELLGGERTALEWLSAAAAERGGDIRAVRGALGAVLLSGDEAEKRCSDLSGGEAARLLLAALMLRRPNLLILDEPTNHLDLEAREALMHALREYDGTLLVVSHDRHFVSAVGTRVLAISAGGVIENFAGDYEEYLERRGEDYLAAAGPRRRSTGGGRTDGEGERDATSRVSEAAGRRAQRERERGATRLSRAVEGFEREVAQIEEHIAALEARFTEPGYYEDTPREQIEADAASQRELRERLAKHLGEWERAAAELEALQTAS